MAPVQLEKIFPLSQSQVLDAQIEIEQSKEIHLLSQLLPENLNNCKFVNALLGQNKVTGVIKSVEILLTTLLQEC